MRKPRTVAGMAAAIVLLTALGGQPASAAGSETGGRATPAAAAQAATQSWLAAMRANAAALARPGEQVAQVGASRRSAAAPALAGKRSRYDAIIARHAAAHGVPLALAHAVIGIESNYRANARGRAGEIGLMQIKPATARGLGFAGTVEALYSPETNLRYGMKYLAEAHRLGGGDICRTVLKYNAGHGARRMNRRSSAYCAEVKRRMAGAFSRAP